MPIVNSIAAMAGDVTAWRRDLHQHPELLYEVHRTAQVVADKLRSFGCDDVATGIGRTGVVALIKGRNPGSRTVALRADMDALPIVETTGLDYASTNAGLMHACGHDGHTAMLLGAARHLAETRNFAGTVAVVFQPAEEGGAGAQAMIDDGLLERFDIDEVYGMHNFPGLSVGSFAIRSGPIMAAADRFSITIEGLGGHAAKPHECIDPIVAGAQIVQAAQAIVARGVDPLDSCVVSITQFHAGTANNIIPQTAELTGTVRCLKEATRDFAEARLREVVEGVARACRVTARVDYSRGYPVTENHAEQTDHAVRAAADIVGLAHVDTATPPTMGAEDFSFMLQKRPGAYILIGNGASAGLHHPAYNFDDAAIPVGVSYWARLVETLLPA